mmetsp:Transcript_11335/g.34344  ORF Transcript_11335/g.34344 Transcript_11335/m.34344 type:complete len:261 (-) Transcript_11335:210-992(-)
MVRAGGHRRGVRRRRGPRGVARGGRDAARRAGLRARAAHAVPAGARRPVAGRGHTGPGHHLRCLRRGAHEQPHLRRRRRLFRPRQVHVCGHPTIAAGPDRRGLLPHQVGHAPARQPRPKPDPIRAAAHPAAPRQPRLPARGLKALRRHGVPLRHRRRLAAHQRRRRAAAGAHRRHLRLGYHGLPAQRRARGGLPPGGHALAAAAQRGAPRGRGRGRDERRPRRRHGRRGGEPLHRGRRRGHGRVARERAQPLHGQRLPGP